MITINITLWCRPCTGESALLIILLKETVTWTQPGYYKVMTDEEQSDGWATFPHFCQPRARRSKSWAKIAKDGHIVVALLFFWLGYIRGRKIKDTLTEGPFRMKLLENVGGLACFHRVSIACRCLVEDLASFAKTRLGAGWSRWWPRAEHWIGIDGQSKRKEDWRKETAGKTDHKFQKAHNRIDDSPWRRLTEVIGETC